MRRIAARRVAALLSGLVAACSAEPEAMDPTLGGSLGDNDDGSVTNLTVTVDPTTSGTGDADASSSGGSDESASTSSDSATVGSDSGSSGVGSSETGVDATPPEVVSVAPTDLVTGVSAAAVITVTFSEVMDPMTVTTNTGSDACSGTLVVSSDAFATCVPMSGPPTSADDTTFTLSPAALLDSASEYRVRVYQEVSDVAGNQMSADYTMPNGFVTRYYHTITIDGINDFDVDDTFDTSTGGAHIGYVAWDDSHMTFGMASPDVGSGDSDVWFAVYLGGAAGTTAGVTYNTQQPLIPFDAQYHLRWRADDLFTGALEWTGAAWAAPAWTLNPGDVFHTGNFVELRVSLIDLGAPAYLPVHLGLLREEAFNEASWAAVPSGSYTDGYDPAYTEYFEFDLTGSTVPAATTVSQ